MGGIDLIVFVTAAYALTRGIIQSELLAPIRWRVMSFHSLTYSLMTCYMCVGLWSGAVLACLRVLHGPLYEFASLSLCSAACCFILARLTGDSENAK